jgi:hypothetical protein
VHDKVVARRRWSRGFDENDRVAAVFAAALHQPQVFLPNQEDKHELHLDRLGQL